jgi:hypothetical protein
MDINQLRVLNDYLNQTIDALSRQQWGAYHPVMSGLSHSQYTPFMAPMGFVGSPFATPFNTPYATPYTQTINPFAQPIVDPFFAQRGLSHSPITATNPWAAAGLTSEIARQNQLTQAVAARQQVLEALIRAAGIPV